MNGRETLGIWYVAEGGVMHHRVSQVEVRILPNGHLKLYRFCASCTGQELEAQPCQ
jgi:hypothetical protein